MKIFFKERVRGSSASAVDTTLLINFFFSEKTFLRENSLRKKKIFTGTSGSENDSFSRRSCNEAAEVGRRPKDRLREEQK